MDNISFLPEDYQENRVQRRTNIISLVLFAVVMSSIVGAYMVTNRQRDEVREQLGQVEQEFEEAARRLDQLDELREQKRRIIRKANVTSVLLERVPRSLVLSELINRMPPDLSLTDLQFDTKVLRVPRIAKTVLDAAKAAKAEDDAAAGNSSDDLAELPVVKPTQVTISLTGMAKTDVEVAQYMARLSKSAMFDDLNLAFSQQTVIDDITMRKFSIRMTLHQEVNVEQFRPLRVKRLNKDAWSSEPKQRLTSFPLNLFKAKAQSPGK